MFCSNCGCKSNKNHSFCSNCGERLLQINKDLYFKKNELLDIVENKKSFPIESLIKLIAYGLGFILFISINKLVLGISFGVLAYLEIKHYIK